jgi:hypothetical protein
MRLLCPNPPPLPIPRQQRRPFIKPSLSLCSASAPHTLRFRTRSENHLYLSAPHPLRTRSARSAGRAHLTRFAYRTDRSSGSVAVVDARCHTGGRERRRRSSRRRLVAYGDHIHTSRSRTASDSKQLKGRRRSRPSKTRRRREFVWKMCGG